MIKSKITHNDKIRLLWLNNSCVIYQRSVYRQEVPAPPVSPMRHYLIKNTNGG